MDPLNKIKSADRLYKESPAGRPGTSGIAKVQMARIRGPGRVDGHAEVCNASEQTFSCLFESGVYRGGMIMSARGAVWVGEYGMGTKVEANGECTHRG